MNQSVEVSAKKFLILLMLVVNVGITTIRVPNLLMRSLLVPSSLAINCIFCVVQAISLM